METIIELGGKKYRVTPVEETSTIDQMVNRNEFSFNMFGEITKPNRKGPFVGFYPTREIAERVVIYGILQSIAHKLNNGETGVWVIYMDGEKYNIGRGYNTYMFPKFKTKESAEQAIRIFENSKFDLKKLFK